MSHKECVVLVQGLNNNVPQGDKYISSLCLGATPGSYLLLNVEIWQWNCSLDKQAGINYDYKNALAQKLDATGKTNCTNPE